MAIRSRIVETVVTVVVIAVGVPLVVMLFLGVLGYCYLEWLLDMLGTRLSMPARSVRTIEASP
ncbi:MAG TPA: hypothetical protein VN415_06635 [Dehalococcoidia bacterium]|nr:hypothetical protein [Dehalococcoidia bacterium]